LLSLEGTINFLYYYRTLSNVLNILVLGLMSALYYAPLFMDVTRLLVAPVKWTGRDECLSY